MIRKITKFFLVVLILSGIAISAVNFFTPQLYAPAFWGTTTQITDPDTMWWYMVTYGPEYMSDHWIGTNQWYCLDVASNCVIVI